MESLKIVHRQNQKAFQVSPESRHRVLVWGTCIRQIAFTSIDTDDLQTESDEVFIGFEAYKFCLEIISGLHSPVFGETEVLGQFKSFFENFAFPSNPWGFELKKFVAALLIDSKRVRARHLKNIGSQTYGSAVRRRLKYFKSVTILGAGQMTESLLPWLDDKKVVVVCREMHQKVRELKLNFGWAEFIKWNDELPAAFDSEVVICAAPLTQDELKHWFLKVKKEKGIGSKLLIDMRDISKQEIKVSGFDTIINLETFFKDIQSTQSNLKEHFVLAKEMVTKLTHDRVNAMQLRPFGWEDICAY
jgi:glutamyl-tRNA reductase